MPTADSLPSILRSSFGTTLDAHIAELDWNLTRVQSITLFPLTEGAVTIEVTLSVPVTPATDRNSRKPLKNKTSISTPL